MESHITVKSVRVISLKLYTSFPDKTDTFIGSFQQKLKLGAFTVLLHRDSRT